MHPTHSRAIVLARILGTAILFFGAQLAWSRTTGDIAGVSNFGQVTDGLYRGAQPSSSGFHALQEMGVGIIVNFRDERDELASEKQQVESLGMKYVEIPWSGNNYPSDAQVLQFLDLVRANPLTKIFVHCKRGADRTGTMVAAYRIAVEHKPVAEAVSEMYQFHYAHFFLPQLQRYVTSLPELLKTNTLYRAYTSVPIAPNVGSGSLQQLSQLLSRPPTKLRLAN